MNFLLNFLWARKYIRFWQVCLTKKFDEKFGEKFSEKFREVFGEKFV